MKFAIADMETDGLIDEVTMMHCFCVSFYEDNKFLFKRTYINKIGVMSVFTYCEKNDFVLVGHKFIQYDLPVIKKLFGIEYKGKVWDTLAMSYKLFPDQPEHNLEYYGEKYKVPKPFIPDWKNLKAQDYIHRCETDVEITTILLGDLHSYFKDIYYPHSPNRDIQYCTWKMDCARIQEENPIKIDLNLVHKTLAEINEELDKRFSELRENMPKVKKYKLKNFPKKGLLKKDGDLSVAGEKWLDLLREKGLPKSHTESIEVLDKVEEPNPGSHHQLKDWLFSLGWEPTIYKLRISKVTGKAKNVPQLQDDDKNLCPNIEILMEKHPELKYLEGMFMIKHRQGVFKAFIEETNDEGYLIASVGGFTNTMRFKHRKPIANLPKVSKPYGKQIRGSLIARDENHLFCGSDMSSLEDSTKQHYMYFYDPDYVKEMRIPGFDPHTDIAVFANLMTKEEEETFKQLKKKEHLSEDEQEIFTYLSNIRGDAKVVNFAGVYGAGPPKLMVVLGCTLEFAQKLHKAYWIRNKAVKQVSADAVYKTVRKQLWLWNPVAKMWYYLKELKDIFSTLNQGTGVYCFDTWLRNVRKLGIKVMLQYHDELGFDFRKEDREEIKTKLQTAIERANEELKLNVPLGISIDIGDNYGEAH